MKRILILLALLTMTATLLASGFKRHTALEKEIQGDWLAAEYYVAQPPPGLQQSIKSMSFQANNIVKWEYVQDGRNKGQACKHAYASVYFTIASVSHGVFQSVQLIRAYASLTPLTQ